MTININGVEPSDIKIGNTAVSEVYIGSEKVRPTTQPLGYLCFTANTANSTVKLTKTGSPTAVTLETSTDGTTWDTYTFGTDITLSNIGDKVYFRNTSETTTGFSINSSKLYIFVMTGSIDASGDVTSLINKNCTDTITSTSCFYGLFSSCTVLRTPPSLPAVNLSVGCYTSMFSGCSSLISCPSLPATTVFDSCYANMFYQCTSLEQLPKLPATTLAQSCYYWMFRNCTKIKLSTTQTGEYQTLYRIPTTGTGTTASSALSYMFTSTGGTRAGTPTINTTYYTSNTVV